MGRAVMSARQAVSSSSCLPKGMEGIRAFIDSEREAGLQAFRHTLGAWIRDEVGTDLLNRIVGGYLPRHAYRRRGERKEIHSPV